MIPDVCLMLAEWEPVMHKGYKILIRILGISWKGRILHNMRICLIPFSRSSVSVVQLLSGITELIPSLSCVREAQVSFCFKQRGEGFLPRYLYSAQRSWSLSLMGWGCDLLAFCMGLGPWFWRSLGDVDLPSSRSQAPGKLHISVSFSRVELRYLPISENWKLYF